MEKQSLVLEPSQQPPEDQAFQPLIEVGEVLEIETDQTFEAALRYNAAPDAGHPGLTQLYGMEPT